MGAPDAMNQPAVVLFDGFCNLCSGSVQFIIKRDPQSKFRFASLQSDFGRQQVARFGFDPTQVDSIVLIEGDRVYRQSDAALRIAKQLSGIWPVLYAGIILPRFLRDAIYNWIARNRYRFFGKKDACWIPTPELKSRFLD
jgi:predicted DCC family thiol-disulfide oxidoreductase YuxK